MKPDAWYVLHAAQSQAESGDITGEKPMWGATGGLDFDGRERWEAWKKLDGFSAEQAKRHFLVAHAAALADSASNFRVTH
jgi:acyl-CoA-binding protein